MMKSVITKLLALGLIFILSGCSNSPEDEPSSQLRVYTFIDFGLTLYDTLILSYQSHLDLTTALMQDSYRMMENFEKIADHTTTSNGLTVEFINMLTKEQTFNEGYSTVFTTNSTDGASTSYFTMTSFDADKTYMLASSSTRLFVPKTTVKTLFKDNSSLNAAWLRSIENHTAGNMYLNIYEIEGDGTVQRVGTTAVIPATLLANY